MSEPYDKEKGKQVKKSYEGATQRSREMLDSMRKAMFKTKEDEAKEKAEELWNKKDET